MKISLFIVLVLLPSLLPAYSYKDHTHYSTLFQMNRNFRVYCPPTYDTNSAKTYPVIYYCNGCGGSYKGDQYTSYAGDGGYVHPYNCWGTGCDPVMNKPYNPDFQMFVDSNDVIIVMVDGKLYGAGGCDVWVPYEANAAWTGNEYRFAGYMRELFHVVDSLYKTKASPQYRAISGLSMGGQASLYLAMFNPHLFRSASSFCYSTSFHSIAAPPNTTPTDPQQFWRNYRGLSMRTQSNTQDYLGHYGREMGVLLQGAGFENEFHLASFWRHWACDIDSQFNFHMRTFSTPKPVAGCFSHMTMYPDFDVWGYTVTSKKAEEGWIYLKDLTKSGLAIQTRYRFPFGKSLGRFGITLTTPPSYLPLASYDLSVYDYRTGAFAQSSVAADDSGRLTLVDSGGMGREYGLSGNGLEPAVTLLADTVSDCIFLRAGADSALAFEAVNLSSAPLSNVKVVVKTDNPFITVKSAPVMLPSFPAHSKVRLDTMVVLNGSYTLFKNIGYIKVYFVVEGDTLDKEHILQVHVMDSLPLYDSVNVSVYENGNWIGKPQLDTGKTYSFYITYPYQDVPDNYMVSLPANPINGQNNPDITFVGYKLLNYNRSRELVEAQVRLNRVPTRQNPIVFPFMTELLYMDPSPGSDKGIDMNVYRYGKIVLPLSPISLEDGAAAAAGALTIEVVPNPFNPVTRIRVRTPLGVSPEVLALFSLNGAKVRTFEPEAWRFNSVLSWNGKDDAGNTLPSGVYFFRVQAKGKCVQTKIVLLK